jgi:uncharacterized protein YraI
MHLKKLVILLIVAGLTLAFALPALAQEGTGITAEAKFATNVRSGPATTFAAIGQLNGGDVVNVTGRSDTSNNWLQIDLDGQAGWVAFFTVNVTGNPDDLPIVEAQAAPVADTEEGEAATTTEEAGTAETTVLTAGTDLFVSAPQAVNVRSGPGTLYTIVGALNAGDAADVTGRDSVDNDWLQIDFSGQEGWVAFFAVNVTGDPDEAPIVEPGDFAALNLTPGQVAAEARENVIGETRFPVSLRAEPGLRSERLAVVPASTRLDIEARSGNLHYLRVTYEEQTGWVISAGVERISGDYGTLTVIADE